MIELLIPLIFTFVIGPLVALIVWTVKESKKARKTAIASESIMAKTMLVLLRNQLMAAHRNAVRDWEITIEEKNSFMEMHDLYIELGGQPPASRLIHDLEKVKLVAG